LSQPEGIEVVTTEIGSCWPRLFDSTSIFSSTATSGNAEQLIDL
jgi:hypothetical protein